jgi:coenzyme Q-binding protein COQ10
MPQFSTRRRVRHSADDMFDLVADIERYPEFVPLCRAMRVIRRTQLADREIVVAEMQVAYKLIRENFTSRVTLIRGERTILVEYLDGPFRQMENRWTFRPLGRGQAGAAGGAAGQVPAGNVPAGDRPGNVPAAAPPACEVEFFISYEFRSRTLGLLMGTMFDTAFRRFASAFESRADAVFGR